MKQPDKKEVSDIYGKLPPQAIECEQAVLGALLIHSDAFYKVSDILTANSFYKLEHGLIFETIQGLINSGSPVDLMIVMQKLQGNAILEKAGGAYFLTQLTSEIATSGHIEYHARIIADAFTAREIIRIATERCAQAYDTSVDIDEVVSGIQNDIVKILETGKAKETTINDAIREVYSRIEWNQKNTGLSGIGTGLSKYDKFTSGLQKTDLVIIAGESSQGKTALAITMVKNAMLYYKAKVAIYSLEMSKEQLTTRIIAQESGVSSKVISSRYISKAELEKVMMAGNKISDLPVYFDESSSSTIDQICNSIRRLKIKYDIDIALVDYLQLVNSTQKGANEETKIAECARRLKNVAKELNITVIALSQLSRNTQNPKPNKNRLRGSGQIEEAADIVMFVWRPEEYGIATFSEPYENESTQGMAELIIAKGRNVGTGSFLTRFSKETTGFYDFEQVCDEFQSADQPSSAIPINNDFNDTPF